MNSHAALPRTMRLLLAAAGLGLAVSTAAPALAQSDTPATIDPAAVADAYGTLSVFILNVAAGLDGVPKDPQGEQVFHDAFAQQMLTAFASMGPQDQQSLGQLPDLRTAVLTAWPQLPDAQRASIAEQWRQSVQSELPGVPCPMYDALARAYLIPGGDAATVKANGDHLVQCWNQYPELARGRNGEDLNAQRQQQQRSSAGNDTIYRGLMNAEVTNYAGTMNMISIMSGDPYRWTVK
jgi:hypothetical protein